MSEGMDRIIAKPTIEKAQKKLLLTFCLSLFGLFLTGCAAQQRHQSAALYVDAIELRQSGENAQAIEKLDTAIQLDSDFSPAYSLLGEIYQQLNDYQSSAESYEMATEINPWSFADFFNLGRVYKTMQKFRKAAVVFTRACQLRTDHLQAHVNAAKCYYQVEDYNMALIYSKQAEQIDPDLFKVHKLLADIFETQKNYDQAIASYKRALELDSDNTGIMTSLAIAYLKTGRNEPAKELLTLVARLKPDNNTAYQYLGYCYLQLNAQATEQYRRERDTNPNNTEMLDSLRLEAENAVHSAVESYGTAVDINQDDWQAHRGLGVAFMIRAINEKNMDLREQALGQWRASLDIKPDQPRRERLLKLIEKYSR